MPAWPILRVSFQWSTELLPPFNLFAPFWMDMKPALAQSSAARVACFRVIGEAMESLKTCTARQRLIVGHQLNFRSDFACTATAQT